MNNIFFEYNNFLISIASFAIKEKKYYDSDLIYESIEILDLRNENEITRNKINKNYKKQQFLYHPDKNINKEGDYLEKSKKINDFKDLIINYMNDNSIDIFKIEEIKKFEKKKSEKFDFFFYYFFSSLVFISLFFEYKKIFTKKTNKFENFLIWFLSTILIIFNKNSFISKIFDVLIVNLLIRFYTLTPLIIFLIIHEFPLKFSWLVLSNIEYKKNIIEILNLIKKWLY